MPRVCPGGCLIFDLTGTLFYIAGKKYRARTVAACKCGFPVVNVVFLVSSIESGLGRDIILDRV